LAGGRLARPKHIDLIVEACRELKVPLKVFGRGFIGENIKYQISNIKYTTQNSKIEFVGEVSDEEKLELMRNARAYIFAAEDEDFGITPVEAMGVGTPVIAYKSGGVVESLIEGKTGLFFYELTVEGLKRTIQQFNNLAINQSDCIKQAQKFSKENFKKEIKKFVYEKFRDVIGS
jgi:glycosyltransferase involved in cell wall biosynthesis